MLDHINNTNQEQILAIVRSIIVCVDIILLELGSDIGKQITVLENSTAILVDDGYAEFRNDFILALDPQQIARFNSSVTLVKNLSTASLELFAELVTAIQRFERKFINDLLDLIANEPEETRFATEKFLRFIFTLNVIAYDIENTAPGNGYGYGYGYGGYGYGGYGYGGYGYGGYGYGGYGYGGYGYGGYGYGGYGYGGYGYGGYGYGYYGDYSQKNRADFAELWDNQDYIWLNQAFLKGVRNAEGLVWTFKDPNDRFTPGEGHAILNLAKISSGDHDQLLFRAVAHAAASDPTIYSKLTTR